MNWKQKLASRKLWAGIVSFVTALLIAFNVDAMTIEQIVIIITGIGALIVYILAEAHVDAKREEKWVIEIEDIEED